MACPNQAPSSFRLESQQTEELLQHHPANHTCFVDCGIHKPLGGSNSGVRAEISTHPACLLAILLSLARQAQRKKETRQFYPDLGHRCGVIPYSSVLVVCLKGLRMN